MKNKSLKSRTIEGFKWSYLSVIFKIFTQLVVISVLAHLIPPKDFGLISIAYIFVNLLDFISKIGVGPALIQLKGLSNKHISSAFSIAILLGIFFYILIWVLSPYISDFFNIIELERILKIIGIIFIINSFRVISLSLLRRNLFFKKLMLIESLSYLIGYGILGISFAFILRDVWALVIAAISYNFLVVLLGFYFAPFSLKICFSIQEVKELLKYGGGVSIGRFFNYLALNGDNFIVGKVLGMVELGIYSRAYTIMTIPVIYFASIIDRVLFPVMAEIQDEINKLKKIFLIGIELIFLVSLTFSIIFYFFAKEIVVILLGDQWYRAIPVIKVLAVAVSFRSGYKISDALSRAVGTVYKRAWRQGVYALLIVSFTYIGTFFGLEVIAWGIVLALVINYYLMTYLSKKSLDLSLNELLKAHLFPIIFGVYVTALCFPLFYFTNSLNLSPVFGLVIKILFFLSIIVAFFIIIPGKYYGEGTKWVIVQIDEKYFGPFKFIKRKFNI